MFGLRFPDNTREHTDSYYASTANLAARYPVLHGDMQADVVVVGGGFSGVNTCLELAERGFHVVLLEARRIAWGASGRNGGQVIGGIGHTPERFRSQIGDAGVQCITHMGVECVEIIRERVARYQIDCDLTWGYCDVALKPRHMRWFEEVQREQQASDYPHALALLDSSEIRQTVNSEAYIGGLYNATGGGHLHPMNLCCGEAQAAAQLGAEIYEQTPVMSLAPGSPATVRTEHGSVTAKFVVLCGNAYMQNLVPRLASRVLPASSCVISTEPLSNEVARSVLPKNVAVCDPRTALDYFRFAGDNSFLFGGLSNYTGLVPANYEQLMQRKMLKIFPQLEGAAITHAWDGQIGIGINRMPQLGTLSDNIYYIQAFSGHGVAPTHMMARITAEAIQGDQHRWQAMAGIRHWPFPGGRYLRRPGLAIGMAYYKAKDML